MDPQNQQPGKAGSGSATVGEAEDRRGLVALATRRPVAVTMLVLTVLVFGLISFARLPRSLMPNISYPSITVRTEYPGASPLDVETRVSRRLEEVLSQVRGLRLVTSVSRVEMSDIILEFSWGSNMSLTTIDVREKIEQVVLPKEALKPTILRYDPTSDPILQIGVVRTGVSPESEEQALIELRRYTEEEIEKELLQVERIAAVKVRGGLEQEYRVDVVESKLRDYGLDLNLINERLLQENLNQASGFLYDGEQSFVVRTVNEFEDIEEIREVILKRDGPVPVRLKDVATVTLSYRDPEVITRINGEPCVKIDIYKEADANVVEVATNLRRRVFGTSEQQAALKKWREAKGDESNGHEEEDSVQQPEQRPNFLAAALPGDHRLEIMSDQSRFIDRSLDNVRRTAISGGLFAILVLYLFLRHLWFTVAVGLSIPISIVAALVALFLCDVSLNMMSLGGLALGVGMLVDNSIVVLESIFRCREEGDSRVGAAIRGTREVSSAVVASTLTTVSVFLPIVFVEGVAGQVFRDQALAVVLSLLASLIVALYFIPMLASRNLGASRSGGGGSVRLRFDRRAWRRSKIQLRKLSQGLRRGATGRRFLLTLLAIPTAAGVFAVLVVRLVIDLCRLTIASICYCVVSGLAWTTCCLRGVFGRHCGEGYENDSGLLLRFRDGYARLLRRCLHRRILFLSGIVFVAYLSWSVFRMLGAELIPELHHGEFTVDLRLPVGTRIEKTDQVVRRLEEEVLRTVSDLSRGSLTTTVGVEKDDITAAEQGEHSSTFLVRLPSTNASPEAEKRVKEHVREICVGDSNLSSVKLKNPVLFSFKTPIEVEVSGFNLQKLRVVTREVEAVLRRIPELNDVKSTIASGYPEVHLRLKRDIMSRYELNVAGVGTLIRNKLEGNVPTYMTDGDQKIGVRVRLGETSRETLDQLAGLIVHPDPNNPLRLSDIADIEVSEGPAEIRRIDHQRAAVVSANLSGMDLGGVVKEIEGALSGITRPPDFVIGFGGQKDEMDQAQSSLEGALVLAIFLVYAVLAIQFESLLQPVVIISAVPLALVGVGPVLWFFDISLSIITLTAMIVLAGIVVNNAIVLVDRVNQLRLRGVPTEEALIEAGQARLRPILMTSLTTVLGLVPLTGVLSALPGSEVLLGSGEGAEIRGPLALTLIAGLITSTALTLFVIPVFYAILDRHDRVSRILGAKSTDLDPEVGHG